MATLYNVVAGPSHPATGSAAAVYTNNSGGDQVVHNVLAIGATAGDAVSLWLVKSGKTLTDPTTEAINAGNPILTVGATQAAMLMNEDFEVQGREWVLAPGDAVFALGSTGDCNLYVLAE